MHKNAVFRAESKKNSGRPPRKKNIFFSQRKIKSVKVAIHVPLDIEQIFEIFTEKSQKCQSVHARAIGHRKNFEIFLQRKFKNVKVAMHVPSDIEKISKKFSEKNQKCQSGHVTCRHVTWEHIMNQLFNH